MNQRWKRCMAVLMTLAMCLSLLPATALAADASKGEEASECGEHFAVQSQYEFTTQPFLPPLCIWNETDEYVVISAALERDHPDESEDSPTIIKLLDDAVENIAIDSGRVIILDLNGHMLMGDDNGEGVFTAITNNGMLKITDSSGKNGPVRYWTADETGLWSLAEDQSPEANAENPCVTVGGVITGANWSGIINDYDGTLILEGGTICGCSAEEGEGGGICNYDNLTITGGTVCGCTAVDGGGVYSDGTFTMSGGTISDSSATLLGGGVFSAAGTFDMSGGIISNSFAGNCGGGVCNSECTFNMTGGTITGCSVAADPEYAYGRENGTGGGVSNIEGTFNMTGGTITGNTAECTGGGVYVYSEGAISLGTKPVIINNHTADDANNNLCLERYMIYTGESLENDWCTSSAVAFCDEAPLLTGADIGVTIRNVDYQTQAAEGEEFTYSFVGGVFTDECEPYDVSFFHSDDSAYYVAYDAESDSLTLIEDTDPCSEAVSYQAPDLDTDNKVQFDAYGFVKFIEKECSKYLPVTSDDKSWGRAGETSWYVAKGEVTIPNSVAALGRVNLILADDCDLTVNGHSSMSAGILVSGEENSLTIYAQEAGTGKLTAIGNTGAGIGGGPDYPDGGNITINGGTVTASDTNKTCAGIGGAIGGTGSNITVNGGTVNAESGFGAAIGGGGDITHEFIRAGECHNVTVNGGTVTAYSYFILNAEEIMHFACAIGGGYNTGDDQENGASTDVKVNPSLIVKAGSDAENAAVIENNGGDLSTVLNKCVFSDVMPKKTTVSYVKISPPDTFTVAFDLQGHGDPIANIPGFGSGDTITAPQPPTAAGWAFGGWFKEAACTHEWNFDSDTVNANTTLYAKWTESAHTHGSWTYSADGAVLTAVCGEADCDLTDSKVTLTLTAPGTDGSVPYAGTAKAVTVNGTDAWTGAGLENPTVNYSVKGTGEAFTPTANNAVPVNAGTYMAAVTFGGNTASVTYTIAKADYDMSGVTFTDGSKTYNGDTQTLAVSGTLPTGADGVQVTVSYSEGQKDVGEKQITATFATTSDNYNTPAAKTAKLTITKANQSAPAAPTGESITGTSVTLTAVSGCEYRLGDGAWQESPVFTGLTKETQYTFYQRLKADSNHNASPASNAAQISTAAHTHGSWTYSADGAVLTAVCGEADCGLTDSKVTLTLTAPGTDGSVTYDGAAKAVTVNGTDAWTDAGLENPTVNYSVKGTGEAFTPTANNAVPVNAGIYMASVTFGGNTASVTYTIAARSVQNATVTLGDALTYIGSEQTRTVASVTVGSGPNDTLTDSDYTLTGNKGTNAGSYELTVTGTGNYTGEKKVSWSIAQASPTYTAPTGLTAKVGQALNDLTLTTAEGDTPGSFAWQDAGTTSVGAAGNNSFQIKFTPADTANYKTVLNIPVTVAVSKNTRTITAPDSVEATYGDTGKSIAASVSGDGELSYAVKNDNPQDVVTVGTDGSLTVLKAGQTIITVTAAETDAYAAASKDVTVIVSPAAGSVETAPAAETLTYSGSDQALVSAGSSSTGSMQYRLGTGDYGTSIPKAANAGTYTVYYKSVGDANHSDTAEQSVSVTIDPLDIADASVGSFASLIYSGQPQTPVAAVTVDDLTVSGTWSAVTNVADKTAFTASGNFTGTIADQDPGMQRKTVDALELSSFLTAPVKNAAPQTSFSGEEYAGTVTWKNGTDGVTGTFLGATVYTAEVTLTPTANYTLTGIGENAFTCTGATSAANAADSGAVTVVFPATGNAALTRIEIKAPAQKTAYKCGEPLDITGLAITAFWDDSTTTEPEVTAAMISGFDTSLPQTGQTLTVTFGEKSASYTISIKKADGSIETAPAAETLTYSGSDQALVSAGSSSTGTMQYRLGTGDYGTSIPKAANAGTYTVYYKSVGDASHNDVAENSVKVVISPAELKVTSAVVAEKTYNGSASGTPESVAFSGLQNGETLTLGTDFTAVAAFNGTNAAGAEAATKVTVTVTLADTDKAGNYSLAQNACELEQTIAKAAVEPVIRITGWTAGDEPNAPQVTAPDGSGVPVFSYKAKDAEDTAYTPEPPTAAGTYVVKAELPETDNYLGAAVTLEFTVSAKPSGGGDSAPAVVNVPVSGDENTTRIKAEVKGTTATVKSIETAALSTVIGADVGTGAVSVDFTVLKSKVDTVVLPTLSLKEIAEAAADENNDTDSLTVKLTTGTVTFDAAALTAIAEQADGKDLALKVDNAGVKMLNDVQKQAIDDLKTAVVLDIYMVSNGHRISDFKGGNAAISIPFEIPAGKTAADYTVYYVAEDGTVTYVKAVYENGCYVFTVTHFSNYVIAEAEPSSTLGGSAYNDCPKDSTCPIEPFTDAVNTAWYHDGVHYCIDKGIMKGISDTAFMPNGDITRAMVVAMLYRMEGSPAVDGENPFSDVPEGQWYTNAVIWGAENGVVKGISATEFAPDTPITREQLVAMIYRFAQTKGEGFTGAWVFPLDFPDAASVSDWADEAMHWCVMKGLVNGMNGQLNPKGTATRAQAATIFMQLCENVLTAQTEN